MGDRNVPTPIYLFIRLLRRSFVLDSALESSIIDQVVARSFRLIRLSQKGMERVMVRKIA